METDGKIKKCEEDSPHRCQYTRPLYGQCPNESIMLPDETYGTRCIAHGGNKQVQSANAKAVRVYRIGEYQQRLEEHADNINIKSLREDIGVLRILLETRLNKIKDDTDLLLQSSAISDLVLKIERLVMSCHKLEGSMKQLVDRAAIIQFASEIIEVIGSILEGQEELMSEIANGILAALGRVGKDDD